MQCKHCLHKFTGGASRISDHYAHSIPVQALMQREHEKRVQKEQESVAKQALEMAICLTAAAAAAAAGKMLDCINGKILIVIGEKCCKTDQSLSLSGAEAARPPPATLNCNSYSIWEFVPSVKLT